MSGGGERMSKACYFSPVKMRKVVLLYFAARSAPPPPPPSPFTDDLQLQPTPAAVIHHEHFQSHEGEENILDICWISKDIVF